jgi:hypothetical protein
MMSCETAARMISEGKDRPLSFGEKMSLRMHLAMCALCRGYQKNLEVLSQISARAGDAVMSAFGRTDTNLALPATSKQRIQDELDHADRSD